MYAARRRRGDDAFHVVAVEDDGTNENANANASTMGIVAVVSARRRAMGGRRRAMIADGRRRRRRIDVVVDGSIVCFAFVLSYDVWDG